MRTEICNKAANRQLIYESQDRFNINLKSVESTIKR
jgi:hypothetical protein